MLGINWCLCQCVYTVFCCCCCSVLSCACCSFNVFSSVFSLLFTILIWALIFIISFYLFIAVNLHREPIIFMCIVNLMMILAFFRYIGPMMCALLTKKNTLCYDIHIMYASETRLHFRTFHFLLVYLFMYLCVCLNAVAMVMNK